MTGFAPLIKKLALAPGSLAARLKPAPRAKARSSGSAPDLRPPGLQAKLELGAVDDPLEHQADRVADDVMRAPAAVAGGAFSEARSRRTDAWRLPREISPPARAKPEGNSIPRQAPGGLEGGLGGGRRLDGETRAFMEARFDRDFGHVRVHEDGAADAAARSVRARAFTMGRDIVFQAGAYAPRSRDGRRLLAHELAHTVQQEGGGLARARGAPLVQRAPATAATASPDDEVLRGAMVYMSSVAGEYAQVAGGHRRVEDAEVTSRIAQLGAVFQRADAQILKKPGHKPNDDSPWQASFQGAAAQIVSASAQTTGRTTKEIYLAHKAELPEWAMPHTDDPKISTPLPLDAAKSASGRPSVTRGGVSIVFAPDKRLAPGKTFPGHPARTGETTADFARRPGYHTVVTGGIIKDVKWSPPFHPTMTITTTYLASAKPSTQKSGYGRGTTADDIAAKTTTLRFHEGNHGLDYVRYLRESKDPYPVLPNGVGMTPAAFEAALAKYDDDKKMYEDALRANSVLQTDCVGKSSSDDCKP